MKHLKQEESGRVNYFSPAQQLMAAAAAARETQTCHVGVQSLDLDDLLAQRVAARREAHGRDGVRHQHQP